MMSCSATQWEVKNDDYGRAYYANWETGEAVYEPPPEMGYRPPLGRNELGERVDPRLQALRWVDFHSGKMAACGSCGCLDRKTTIHQQNAAEYHCFTPATHHLGATWFVYNSSVLNKHSRTRTPRTASHFPTNREGAHAFALLWLCCATFLGLKSLLHCTVPPPGSGNKGQTDGGSRTGRTLAPVSFARQARPTTLSCCRRILAAVLQRKVPLVYSREKNQNNVGKQDTHD